MELIEGCIQNKRTFQEAFYRKHYPAMMRMVMSRVRDNEAGLEILNNGFLKAFKNMSSYSGQGSLEGWLRRLVLNCLSDYFRSNKTYMSKVVFEEVEESAHQNGLTNLYFKDLIHLLDQLPPATKKVFSLYAIEGYKHQEISDMLQISTGTSKWHLANARNKLKSLLEENKSFQRNAG